MKIKVLYLWFRLTLPNTTYRALYGTEHDLRKYKVWNCWLKWWYHNWRAKWAKYFVQSVFETWGKEKAFSETCRTKTTKSGRGWCFPVSALPAVSATRILKRVRLFHINFNETKTNIWKRGWDKWKNVWENKRQIAENLTLCPLCSAVAYRHQTVGTRNKEWAISRLDNLSLFVIGLNWKYEQKPG